MIISFFLSDHAALLSNLPQQICKAGRKNQCSLRHDTLDSETSVRIINWSEWRITKNAAIVVGWIKKETLQGAFWRSNWHFFICSDAESWTFRLFTTKLHRKEVRKNWDRVGEMGQQPFKCLISFRTRSCIVWVVFTNFLFTFWGLK